MAIGGSDATGCVTGRFQPLHLDHLELLLYVLERHDRLVVAITNPDPARRTPEVANPARHLPESNPFTYWERLRFVRVALAEAGVEDHRIDVVPFPMDRPAEGFAYAPAGAVQYVRIYSPWEREKIERLRAAGWRVAVVDAPPRKALAGTDVREALRAGGEWREALPAAVARLVEAFLAERPLCDR